MKQNMRLIAVTLLVIIAILASVFPVMAQGQWPPYPPYPPAPAPPPSWTAVQKIPMIITNARNLVSTWKADLAAQGWQAVGSPWWDGAYWEVMVLPMAKAATAPLIPIMPVVPDSNYGGGTFCQLYPSAWECTPQYNRWY